MAATIKLNQAVAIEKGIKARTYAELNEIHKALQKPDMLYGMVKSYMPVSDDGVKLPPEHKSVQLNAERAFVRIALIQAEAWDIEATKDLGNTTAFADVVVDGVTLIERAPATLLLHLEKQLNDMRVLVEKMVPLSDDRVWSLEATNGLWKSEPSQTHRTEKQQKAIVKYPATEHHPAQTEMVVQDVLVGFWSTVNFSGALPTTRKLQILDRIDTLTRAVKIAREQANMVEVPRVAVGKKLFEYLFKV